MGIRPNLLIAGVAKAGTTSLFAYLGQHAQVCPSDLKELYVLEGGDVSAYDRHFSHCNGEPIRLEASPRYCWAGEPVMSAIEADLPDARIIVVLREPVSRFHSGFRYRQGRGALPRGMTPEEFLERCLASDEGQADAVAVGRYADYVPPWLERFGARLRVVFFDELSAHPGEVVADLCRWLGLDPPGAIDYSRRNAAQQPRSRLVAKGARAALPAVRTVLGPRTRERVRRLYEATNARPSQGELAPHLVARLQELYAPSNHAMAAVLRAHGYTALPEWLGRA